MQKLKKKIIIVSLLFLTVISEFIYLTLLVNPGQYTVVEGGKNLARVPLTKEEFASFRDEWSENIEKLGAQAAYESFKEKYQDLNTGREHELAHIFGELLYETEGVAGVAVCDSSFAYGCYHTFLGSAINDRGLEIIYDLDAACAANLKNQGLGCQHGLGHGIVGTLGYQTKTLPKALALCETLKGEEKVGGCTGGVFMEYNLQTMLGRNGKLRSFDEKNPYFPCLNLAEKYRQACYFWQTQWWGGVLSGGNEEVFTKIGLYCQNLTNKKEKDQCFKGTGNNMIGFTGWEVSSAINLCKKMPDLPAEVKCRAGAAGVFFADPKTRNKAKELCDGLGEQEKDACLVYARLDV